MEIAARLPWTDLGDGTLTQAHIARTLPDSIRAPGPQSIPQRLDGMRPALLNDIVADLDREAQRPWEPLRDPEARAVVTGQQPGCAGGTLLVLYKAATAVALARRIARASGRPVVPIFWNASDDVDFDEVARVAWPQPDGGLGFLELPRDSRRSQAYVGALPADGDVRAARAAAGLVDPRSRAHIEAVVPAAARDHGDWVGQLLRRVFPDLAILDARSAALRRHAAPLFERYLVDPANTAALAQGAGERLEAAGFARTLAAASTRLALFMVRDGQRHKTDGDVEPLRLALQTDASSLAPNVVLRPLVQDYLLPVVASVVGPSELGYLLELRDVRRALKVEEPALVPRLTMTSLDADAWKDAAELGLGALEVLGDSDETWRAVARRQKGTSLGEVRAAFSQLDAALEKLETTERSARLGRTRRRAAALGDDLYQHLEGGLLQALWAERPALAALRTSARPRGRPQERLLAGLWLLGRWGESSGAHLIELADAHLDAMQRDVVEHFVVTD